MIRNIDKTLIISIIILSVVAFLAFVSIILIGSPQEHIYDGGDPIIIEK